MPPIAPTVAEMLSAILAVPHTRREVAERLGVTERSVGNWLADTSPRPKDVRAIRRWYRRLRAVR